MTDEWGTPQELFDKLNDEFHFTVDVCASVDNFKVSKYYTKEQDGLSLNWTNEIVWMNLPYGRGIEKWMKKAYEESELGSTIVTLIPDRCNPPWWHNYVLKSEEICYILKKVPFIGSIVGVPFWGSAVVIFKKNSLPYPKVSSFDYPRPKRKTCKKI